MLFQEFIKVIINNINEKKMPFIDVPDLNRVNLMTRLKLWSKTRTATFRQGHGSTHCLTFRMSIFMIHDLALKKKKKEQTGYGAIKKSIFGEKKRKIPFMWDFCVFCL